MAKRLTRAKQKIARAADPVPGARRPAELPDRLGGVPPPSYLLFNEGYAAGSRRRPGAAPALVDEAIRLARLLAG